MLLFVVGRVGVRVMPPRFVGPLFEMRVYDILALARISLDPLSGCSGPLLSGRRPLVFALSRMIR
jgi:hypothetical protein